MLRCFATVVVVLGLGLVLQAQTTVSVPDGKPVMLDGKLEPGQWSDATQVEMGGGARLRLKTSQQFAYIAVEFPATRSGFTDLYVALPDGRIYDLHASAKLGERRLLQGKWPEWRDWWNNKGWVANVSRVDSFEQRTFLPTTVRQYQIERSVFTGSEWNLAVDMSTQSTSSDDYSVVRWPASANELNPKTWLKVRFLK